MAVFFTFLSRMYLQSPKAIFSLRGSDLLSRGEFGREKNKISYQRVCQSINQLNPVLLKERVRIPRTRRAGGTAML